jgi:hypothetical protein
MTTKEEETRKEPHSAEGGKKKQAKRKRKEKQREKPFAKLSSNQRSEAGRQLTERP